MCCGKHSHVCMPRVKVSWHSCPLWAGDLATHARYVKQSVFMCPESKSGSTVALCQWKAHSCSMGNRILCAQAKGQSCAVLAGGLLTLSGSGRCYDAAPGQWRGEWALLLTEICGQDVWSLDICRPAAVVSGLCPEWLLGSWLASETR